MINPNRRLLVEQLDEKLEKLLVLRQMGVPSKGWINAIRTAMNMSLVQLAKRLKITSVSVREIEEREKNKNITLKKLTQVAEALSLQLVYGFIPRDSSIEKMIEHRALQVAREIVMRTSHTMELEEQENRETRLQKAIKDRAKQIQQEMPKYLWD
ncbi:MAG: mobile mystery protein A [Bacteroidota bacterium]|jgi:predicted DNA-binding mobile mystery protein A